VRIRPVAWNHLEYHANLLAPVGKVVTQMERRGIPVSVPVLDQIEQDMREKAEGLRKSLGEWTGGKEVNWNSWQQLAAWLHDSPGDGGLGLEPSPYCKKGEVPDGEIKTDDRALEWLAGHSEEHRQGIQNLRLLRQCDRMARYARDWLQKGLLAADDSFRLHPSFGLASDNDSRPGAVTGRFGVKNPPLNQVPRNPAKDPAGMRRAFIPPPGCRLIVVDYSQLEVVILAHIIAQQFGEDDKLVQAVRADADIHALAARFIWGELAKNKSIANVQDLKQFKDKLFPELVEARDNTKSGVYGKNYGKGKKGFATSVFLPNGEPLGEERASLLVDGLDAFYPGVPRYQSGIRSWIERHGFISTLFGRYQPTPLARDPKMGNRNRAWRQSLNFPMQGGGQEIMALAIIAIENDLALREMGFELSLVVHDEVVGWAPEVYADEALARVENHMVSVVELQAPLRAKGHTGPNWAEAK
jgi:DNA polymerase I